MALRLVATIDAGGTRFWDIGNPGLGRVLRPRGILRLYSRFGSAAVCPLPIGTLANAECPWRAGVVAEPKLISEDTAINALVSVGLWLQPTPQQGLGHRSTRKAIGRSETERESGVPKCDHEGEGIGWSVIRWNTFAQTVFPTTIKRVGITCDDEQLSSTTTFTFSPSSTLRRRSLRPAGSLYHGGYVGCPVPQCLWDPWSTPFLNLKVQVAIRPRAALVDLTPVLKRRLRLSGNGAGARNRERVPLFPVGRFCAFRREDSYAGGLPKVLESGRIHTGRDAKTVAGRVRPMGLPSIPLRPRRSLHPQYRSGPKRPISQSPRRTSSNGAFSNDENGDCRAHVVFGAAVVFVLNEYCRSIPSVAQGQSRVPAWRYCAASDTYSTALPPKSLRPAQQKREFKTAMPSNSEGTRSSLDAGPCARATPGDFIGLYFQDLTTSRERSETRNPRQIGEPQRRQQVPGSFHYSNQHLDGFWKVGVVLLSWERKNTLTFFSQF
ncbi:hypothetical protein FA13DRAFT_1710689 [Coprinellus micaceus]|uniref:Uncharacterized protein n=1 Tax=Coprinellus micaceus TaxID=71717 RepID=A0A4Y7T6H9_COPMI|nr:hypothetical protein FA13DRAFT_1710689 [Coprinellus micaceus]